MAVLAEGSDAPSAVDDRAESPAAFGSLDSLTGLRSAYVTPAWPQFVLRDGLWLQPDSDTVVNDSQGTWGVLS